MFQSVSLRWSLVVSGCIDGYSRLITHLCVADNNRANTTLGFFLRGTTTFGTPRRLRCDHGGENRLVARFMIMRRGRRRGSVIAGRSVHNQRIERLWVDVFARCLHVYYNLFHVMEDHNILNISNAVHEFALRYVFLNRIQTNLTTFANAWNSHNMDSLHGRTPLQTWILSMVRDQRSRDPQSQDTLQPHANFQPNRNFTHTFSFSLPTLSVENLSQHNITRLQQTINPNSPSNSRGVDIYAEVVAFIQNCLQ